MRYVEAEIWLALKSRIDALVTNPAMMVFEPGQTIDTPIDGASPRPFILASDVRNDNARIGIDPKLQARSGTLILSIQWPITYDVTHAQLMQIAGSIAAHFPCDQRMKLGATCLRVTRVPDCMQPYRDGSFHSAVVRIPWSTT